MKAHDSEAGDALLGFFGFGFGGLAVRDPDAWLEDARQGATPGLWAPQPLLKKVFRVSGFRV